jgi:hypothetical protein
MIVCCRCTAFVALFKSTQIFGDWRTFLDAPVPTSFQNLFAVIDLLKSTAEKMDTDTHHDDQQFKTLF